MAKMKLDLSHFGGNKSVLWFGFCFLGFLGVFFSVLLFSLTCVIQNSC